MGTTPTPEPHDGHRPTVDPRPRQLLEKYASLTGAVLMDLGEGLLAFDVPEGERKWWDGEERVTVALTPEALDEDPEAELLGIGSPAFERLLSAIRARGFLEIRGTVAPAVDPAPKEARIPVPIEGAEAGTARVEVTLVPVGRLLARVSIKAGPRLEERLVESPFVDLSTGAPVGQALEEVLRGLESDGKGSGESEYPVAPRCPPERLLPMLFDELARELEAEISRMREEAERSRKAEAERLQRYYGAMEAEVEPEDGEPDAVQHAKRAIRAELERRLEEETERYRVRVTLHPLQLAEWRILAQRACWPLTTPAGGQAELMATRLLAGDTSWRLTCPLCGNDPSAVRVCREGHASCPACSERCGVCGRTTCREHGLATCAVEGHPVCGEHARTCSSCGTSHCTTHGARCRLGDHDVCPACAVTCGRCGVELCKAHGTATSDLAPLGARWLCDNCMVHCEGGTNEPVGLDEVVRCTACERHICSVHQVVCAVDDAPHCSRHLRRSDRSGRLACESHRVSCADEPGSVLASDEVAPCATCGRAVCETHGGTCVADGARHCTGHLAPLADLPGQRACEAHRTTCQVDRVAFSMTGTEPCPVCGKPTCKGHQAACSHCARRVCVRDVAEAKCLTCRRLEEVAEPTELLIEAAIVANGGEVPKARTWRTAQDGSGTVVELELGWTKRLVLFVPHGEGRPRTVVQHHLFGSKRMR
jgi:hypothetical protein